MVVVPPPCSEQTIVRIAVPTPGSALPPERLAQATRALKADGMVILSGTAPLPYLRSSMHTSARNPKLPYNKTSQVPFR